MPQYTPLERNAAIKLMFDNFSFTPKTETVPVQEALGRVNISDITSQFTLPVYRVSAMDGIAVKFEAFASGMPDTSIWQKGVDYVYADTGDDFPDAYDTIIMVEKTEELPQGGIKILEMPAERGQLIKAAGDSMQQGELLVKAHTMLNPRNIAMLMAGGITNIDVVKKPRVAFIPTGSELISAGNIPQRGQNIETNGFMFKCYLDQWGTEPVILPTMKDSKNEIGDVLQKAIDTCDIVIINAGSSKGQEDFTLRVLEQTGQVFAHCLKNAPGRPVTLAVVAGKPVIGVPGPPIGADNALRKTVRPFINRWFGIDPIRATVLATLTGDIKTSADFDIFVRVVIEKTDNGYTAYELAKGKNLPASLSLSQGLLTVPIGTGLLKKGDLVEIEID